MSDLASVPSDRPPLRLGVTGMSRLPADRVAADTRQAEEDGFDYVLWPDHLMAWHSNALWQDRYTPLARYQPDPHQYLNVITCLAAAAVTSSRVMLGSGVTDVIRTHPATLAQQFLSLHHLSGGRALLGLGAGEGENLTPYGASLAGTVGRLEDALEIIRMLWSAEGPVNRDSAWWPLRDAVLGLGPVPGVGFPPIWLAAHGPRMLEITGRLADGWLPMLMAPDVYAARLATIAASRSAAGRDASFTPALWSYVCYGESREACLELFESPMYKTFALLLPASDFEALGRPHPLGASGLGGFIPTRLDEEQILRLTADVPVELVARCVLHGTVDDVHDDLRALQVAGMDVAVLGNVSFLTDRAQVRPSFAAQRELVARVTGKVQV
ncbi:MAG: phthiodiolone/phenolphthiodiolone dimycocerosates ketoreductase [Pseudonocardiales bacterium]|nr:phthiodiolone/phenolphthiodiolone dimycocerosates ketoreductase [Pseudonocardiales bacterium]